MAFTVFLFRHCLLSHFAISTCIFVYLFPSFSFSIRLSFFPIRNLVKWCHWLTFSTSLHIDFEVHCKLTSVQHSDWYIGMCISIFKYTGCNRRNVRDFGRVFLMLNYTDITQNTYIQSWTVTELMTGEVWNFDSCYSLIDYQIRIETGRNMWFL